MKTAVYYNNSDIRIEERPVPRIKEGEILVSVKASGICGTDTMEWYRTPKAPRVLGHEIAGDIVESASRRYKIGQRVFVSHHVPCNACKYCLAGDHTACDTLHGGNYIPGGYSEFIEVPAINAERGTYALPDAMSYEEGTMIEPLACVVRAQRVIGVKKGQTVLVLGSGVSGLLNIRLAKLKGATVIATDICKYRLDKAAQSGADRVLDGRAGLDVKADRVIICTAAFEAAAQAFKCIDKKGVIQFFAIPDKNIELPVERLWRDEITVSSSYGAAPADIEEALGLIERRHVAVKDLITHKLPLADIQKGFKIVSEAKESLKVVLIP
jgi:L-iditol 2-dehydrogenase